VKYALIKSRQCYEIKAIIQRYSIKANNTGRKLKIPPPKKTDGEEYSPNAHQVEEKKLNSV